MNGVRKLLSVIIPAVTRWNIKLIPQVKNDWAIEHNLIKGGIDYSVARLHTTAVRPALHKHKSIRSFLLSVPSVILLLLLAGCDSLFSPSLKVSGVTEYESLVSSWSQSYSDENKNERIHVQSQEFKIGINDLLNGKSDIFFSHEMLDDINRLDMIKNGVSVIEMPMARDGSVLIVQASSIVEGMRLDDMQSIFNGSYDRWDDFSQLKGHLKLYADKHDKLRNEFFKDKVLKNTDWSSDIVWLDTQKAVIDSVKLHQNAIGLVGLSSPIRELNAIKVISVDTEDERISPVINRYPLGYSVYFYYNRDAFEKVKKFIQFCSSNNGKRIALQKGVYPIM